jgi:pyrophosphatase PpaX
MASEFEGAIFDLDGTVLNTDLYIIADYIHLFQKFAPERMPSLEDMIYFSGPPLSEVFAKWLPDSDPAVLKKEFLDFSLAYSNSLSSLYPGEMETLKRLKASGLKLGLVTNKSALGMENNLAYFHLKELFSSLYPIERCLKKKPDPWPLTACAAELGINPEKTVYLGDDISDINAGRAAGMKTGLVLFGLKKIPSEPKPDYRFQTYEGIERRLLYGE